MRTPCLYKKMVPAYADKLLSAKKMALMEPHIAKCAICRQELEDIQLTEKLLKDLPEIEPSRDFSRTFWQKVDAIEATKNKWSLANLFSSGWRPYLAPSVAFALLLLVFTFYRPVSIQPETEDIIIAEHIEFLDNYYIVDNLELLENWDIIENLEERS